MSDELGYGLIVYSWANNTSWRVTHSYFMPDPLAGDYNVGGLNFQWGEEGIFGMSLSPIAADGFRTLFFHPLSSNREFAVSTEILRDPELALDSYHSFQVSFVLKTQSFHCEKKKMSLIKIIQNISGFKFIFRYFLRDYWDIQRLK